TRLAAARRGPVPARPGRRCPRQLPAGAFQGSRGLVDLARSGRGEQGCDAEARLRGGDQAEPAQLRDRRIPPAEPRRKPLAMRDSDPLARPEMLVRRVYAYVAYRLGPGPDAEDVTNDVFERALRYRDSYDRTRSEPVSWLVGIARRCIAESVGDRHA